MSKIFLQLQQMMDLDRFHLQEFVVLVVLNSKILNLR